MTDFLKPHVIIYTDGGAHPNPGTGGWAAILYSPEHDYEREIYGAERNTTNNRMELTAAIRALEALNRECDVDLFTDSEYLYNAFAKRWITNWQKNNWRGTSKNGVLNRDLWEKLIHLVGIHNVKFHHVRGHSDNERNNRCDILVQKAIHEIQ